MPLSRKRKFTKAQAKRKRPLQAYRRVLHKGLLAYIRGFITREQWQFFKSEAKRAYLLGKVAA